MSDQMALKIAINLIHVPSQVRLMRSEPLPDDVLMLLRIAAGDRDTEQTAVALTGRAPEFIRRAASFFIEQILFAPDADCYRVLGASEQASAGELRRNMGLLLRWLHPDVDPRGERSPFVGRVTGAWNNLKTPERRSAYDSQRQSARAKRATRLNTKSRSRRQAVDAGWSWRVRTPRLMHGAVKVGFLRRALSMLFGRPSQ